MKVFHRQPQDPVFSKMDMRRDFDYCQTSNISRSLVDNKIVNHADVVGASPVGAAPTTSSS